MRIWEKDVMDKAIRYISSRDPVALAVISSVGRITPSPVGDVFQVLVRSVVSQQLSSSVAERVMERVLERLDRRLDPGNVLKLGKEGLRGTGLSGRKIDYVMGIAKAFSDNPSLLQLEDLDDSNVIGLLDSLPGVGIWTAKMVMIFSLGRTDVWPHEDLGIVKAVKELYGNRSVDTVGEIHRPYRSVLALYLWKWKDRDRVNPLRRD